MNAVTTNFLSKLLGEFLSRPVAPVELPELGGSLLFPMTIKFTCTCGKRLRARDEMASRRTFCPRCGRPIGVPSGQATARGTEAAPLSPLDRQREQFHRRVLVPRREAAASSAGAGGATAKPQAPLELIAAPEPLDVNLLRLVFAPKHPRRQHPSHVEKWHHSLTYPIRTIRLVLTLSASLTALIVVTLLLLPKLFELEAEPVWVTLILLPSLMIPFTVIGYSFGYLESVLASAASGEAEPLRKATRKVGLAARSFAVWMLCFLAGPIVPAALAVFFWINSGDLEWIDWAILAELGVVSGAYWLFVMLSVSRTGRLRDVNPLEVFDLIGRLGFRAMALVLGASVFLIAHVVLSILAVQGFHEEPGLGASLLFAFLASALFWATFFFRLLGVWCYRLRVRLALAEEEAAT